VIFVDTSFLVAYALERDSRHADAVAALRSPFSREPLATSTLVLGETWTTLRARLGHARTRGWLDALLALPHLRAERIDEQLEDDAWAWLRVHDERPYTFVDATSFALMRRLRITEALAFDGDFAAAGFTELQRR
jgi:predicted nucleic acid-binding protein